MTGTGPADVLKNLIFFIACLAVAASILAGALYLAVDLPAQQQAIKAPENKFVAPWYNPDCTEACNNLYLAHTINAAAWTACLSTCCGGGIDC